MEVLGTHIKKHIPKLVAHEMNSLESCSGLGYKVCKLKLQNLGTKHFTSERFVKTLICGVGVICQPLCTGGVRSAIFLSTFKLQNFLFNEF